MDMKKRRAMQLAYISDDAWDMICAQAFSEI